MPTPRRFLMLAALVTPGLLAAAPAARAHLMVEGAEPADGAVLSSPPRSLALRFSEASRITSLRLVDEAGREVPLRRDAARGAVTSVTAGVTGPLTPGGYRVEWRAVGADGHVMNGTVHFTLTSR